MDTIHKLKQLLSTATDDGTLDELAVYVHPDVINRFCDAVTAMAEAEG